MKFMGANGFTDFISGYGLWIIVGCLGLAFIVALIFLFLNINKSKKAKTLIPEKETLEKTSPQTTPLEEVIVKPNKTEEESK